MNATPTWFRQLPVEGTPQTNVTAENWFGPILLQEYWRMLGQPEQGQVTMFSVQPIGKGVLGNVVYAVCWNHPELGYGPNRIA